MTIEAIYTFHPLPWRLDADMPDGYVWDASGEIVGSMGGASTPKQIELELAMLVVASPVMLAALERAERNLVAAYGESVPGASLQSEEGSCCIDDVRAAIWKAKGAGKL